MKKIAVIMGSDSDLPVVGKAVETVRSFGVECEAHVYSAHRTPAEAKAFAESAREHGFGVIIAAAGMAAHLAGALAASTTLPVIGIPVATVGVDGAVNAALLALEILAVSEPELAEKLAAKRAADKAKVLEKDAALEAKLAAMRG